MALRVCTDGYWVNPQGWFTSPTGGAVPSPRVIKTMRNIDKPQYHVFGLAFDEPVIVEGKKIRIVIRDNGKYVEIGAQLEPTTLSDYEIPIEDLTADKETFAANPGLEEFFTGIKERAAILLEASLYNPPEIIVIELGNITPENMDSGGSAFNLLKQILLGLFNPLQRPSEED